jgi:four helix bundle protein
MTQTARYRELKVWQRGMDLVVEIHRMTAGFPSEERFGLTALLRRAATSVPLNIAEGSCRGTRRDYAAFIAVAAGSTGEVDTGLEIAIRLGYVDAEAAAPLLQTVVELARMLRALRSRLLDPAVPQSPIPNPQSL